MANIYYYRWFNDSKIIKSYDEEIKTILTNFNEKI